MSVNNNIKFAEAILRVKLPEGPLEKQCFIIDMVPLYKQTNISYCLVNLVSSLNTRSRTTSMIGGIIFYNFMLIAPNIFYKWFS